ncbi:carboxypeptidase A2 [Pocillopora verrucosa]|uniref:carboxypeptidase A2 n=1 Tax=Pocillopora verrucosa TaxID=203993 RepID=UPI003340E8A0
MASKLHFAVFLSLVMTASAGEKVIRIIPGDSNELDFLSSLEGKQELELDFWKAPHKPGLAVDIHVTDAAYKIVAKLLKEKNIEFQIMIVDVDKLVDDENELQTRSMSFSFDSQYHPLQEIVDELRNFANQHAGIASIFNLGKSYEGREQQAIKLKGRYRPGKKVFFMNCGIHAREWVSPATCMYIIRQIVSKYGRDSSVTEMLDKMDFVIMPVLNVDGYVFTWNPSSRRNRFWRKTRKPNRGSRCIGTDPNRNWDYMWGYPGASSDPCQDSYRGTHAFSEREVKNVANYLETLSRNDQIAGYMDIHAYSQLWMTPWGYTRQPTRDNEELMRVSKAAVTAIRRAGYGTYYRYGPSSVIIYQNSGGSKDYTYGKLKIKYSFALELRDTGRYGFLLPARQIVPTAMETFEGIKTMAREMRV